MTNTVVDSVGNKLLKALLTELQMLSPRFQHMNTEAMLVLCDMDQFVGGMDTIKPASPQKDAFGGDDD